MAIIGRNKRYRILVCLRLGMLFAFQISVLYILTDMGYEFKRIDTMKRIAQPGKDKTSNIIIHRTFTESQNRSNFILGAVGKNSTSTATWDQFAIYGQWYNAHKLNVHSLRCCFKYSGGVVLETQLADFDQPTYKSLIAARLRLWHATCDNPQYKQYSTPSLISIARDCSCSNPSVNYLQPYLALKRPPEHITVTTKLAYGNIDPEIVVSYLETVRYLGMDRVVTYVIDNLNPSVERILRHYASTGLVEYHNLELADRTVPRPFVTPQYISDEWLVKRDALERNIGSEFFGIFDMDEYLIPSGNRTYKQLLRSLRKAYPKASNFVFTNKHYLTDYKDLTCTSNCTLFKRHIKTPPHEFDYNLIHKKLISIRSRVKTNSINNHDVISLNGYVQQVCPKEEAYVRHFGSCTRKFPFYVCYMPFKWVEDRSVALWAEKTIENKVLTALKRVSP